MNVDISYMRVFSGCPHFSSGGFRFVKKKYFFQSTILSCLTHSYIFPDHQVKQKASKCFDMSLLLVSPKQKASKCFDMSLLLVSPIFL
jgi:hypothetical protein